MKLIKKILLSTLLIIGLSFCGNSQSYSTGNYYAYRGQTKTEYNYSSEYNYNCRCYVTVKYCRQLSWYQQYHSGYVYYWGPSGWYTQWYEGYSWYCVWSAWYRCY